MRTSERIAQLDKERGAKVAAMQELVEKSSTENRVLTDDENGVFQNLKLEIGNIQRDLDNLREMEGIIAKHAQLAGTSQIIVPNSGHLQKGVRFARYVMAVAQAQGNIPQAIEIAKSNYRDTPEIEQMLRAQNVGLLRAAVPAATTTDPAWAGALAAANTISGEMIDLVFADAVLGKLSLRRVPFNVRIPRVVTAMGVAAWVGQGLSKPVGKAAFDLVTIPFTKCSLITLLTEELARFSSPSAEPMLAQMLRDSITMFLDDQFIHSGIAPVANVQPGGITNGLPAGQTFPSSGTDLANIQYDLARAVSILNAESNAVAPAWIMHPSRLVAVQAATNGLGMPAFPSTNGSTPTLYGYPVYTTPRIDQDEVILLDQRQVLLATDGGITVDVSREASVQADSAPATPPTPLISLWQQNMIGLRAEQFIYWQRARDEGVVLITAVEWGTVAPPTLPLAGRAGTAAAPRTPATPPHKP